MSVTIATSGLGIPVAVGEIDRQLKKLWEESGSAMARASLINLAVYCEGQAAMAANTALIAQITKDHACRAILICAEPQAAQSEVRAWISAHCHLSRAGAKQICCEQISFLLEGESGHLIPNIVFSHLDSDLPLVLWWQGEFHDPIDATLWTWVDRLLFDSASWLDKCHQIHLLRDSLPETGRLMLCDLNWTRTLWFRQALSATFDTPQNLPLIDQIHSVELVHAPLHRCTALLLLGWLATRLGWTLREETGDSNTPVFSNANGQEIRASLVAREGPPLSACTLHAGDARFHIAQVPGSPFLHEEAHLSGEASTRTLFPAGSNDPALLLDEELGVAGRPQLYLQALSVAGELW